MQRDICRVQVLNGAIAQSSGLFILPGGQQLINAKQIVLHIMLDFGNMVNLVVHENGVVAVHILPLFGQQKLCLDFVGFADSVQKYPRNDTDNRYRQTDSNQIPQQFLFVSRKVQYLECGINNGGGNERHDNERKDVHSFVQRQFLRPYFDNNIVNKQVGNIDNDNAQQPIGRGVGCQFQIRISAEIADCITGNITQNGVHQKGNGRHNQPNKEITRTEQKDINLHDDDIHQAVNMLGVKNFVGENTNTGKEKQ